ncbi:hypothetical protein EX30DRAFT_288029, partial [Ascodesmis nigricans]
SSTSKAGITTNAEGQRIIPSSVRADGSARREIRVRAGYVPPEDVEIYQNRRAEAWKNQGRGGVPGAEVVDDSKTDPAKANKNAKRRAARKRAAEAATADGDLSTAAKENTKKEADPAPEEQKPVDEQAEKEKKAKAIRKKIRQANDLKSRREGGEALLPEQLDKIIKLNELMRQLKALGFD